MQRRIAQFACIIATMMPMSACGGSESRKSAPAVTQSSPPHFTNDQERARYALLPPTEVPAEVKRQKDKRNSATCSPRVLFKDGATALLTTRRYVIEGGTVQQTVALFRDARAAERAFGRLDSSSNRRCITQYTHDAIAARTHVTVPQLTHQMLNIEALGQQWSAFRLFATAVDETVGADILLNRVRRAISSVSVTWQAFPEDLEFQEQLVARIATRLRRALS